MVSYPRSASCLPIIERGCCLQLRTVCLWHAWLCLLGYIGTVALFSMHLIMPNDDEQSQKLKSNHDYEVDFDDIIKKAIDRIGYNTEVLLMIFSVIGMGATCLFINGIHQNNPRKLLPYIYLSGIQVLGSVAIIILSAFVYLPALSGLVTVALPIYFLICANSLHVQMVEAYTNQPTIINPNFVFQKVAV